ncbi:hypothetical protein B8A32_03745 [Loigolactobacillus backii]|nr:hypothetical protein B8A32_03745 [Loigolactobacillus backii]
MGQFFTLKVLSYRSTIINLRVEGISMESERKVHFKLYKAGKKWLAAGIIMGGIGLATTVSANAATTPATDATAVTSAAPTSTAPASTATSVAPSSAASQAATTPKAAANSATAIPVSSAAGTPTATSGTATSSTAAASSVAVKPAAMAVQPRAATTNQTSDVQATPAGTPVAPATTAPVQSNEYKGQAHLNTDTDGETINGTVYNNAVKGGTESYKTYTYMPQFGSFTNNGTTYNLKDGSSMQSVMLTKNGSLYALYNDGQNNLFVMGMDKTAQAQAVSNNQVIYQGFAYADGGTANSTSAAYGKSFQTLVNAGHVTFSSIIKNGGHGQSFSTDGTKLYLLSSSNTNGNGAATIYAIDPSKNLAVTTLAKSGVWYPYSGTNASDALYLFDLAFQNDHTFYFARTMNTGNVVAKAPTLALFKGTIDNGKISLQQFQQVIPAVTNAKKNIALQNLSYDPTTDTMYAIYNGVIESFNLTSFINNPAKVQYKFVQLSGNAQNRETESITFMNGYSYILEGQENEILTNKPADSTTTPSKPTNPTNPAQKDGWSGASYYQNGSKLTGFQTIAGQNYLFDQSGSAKTGVQKVNNTYYDFGSNYAAIKNSYAKSQWGDWYLFGSNGKIQTGVQKWAGTYYYFDPHTYLKRTNAYLQSQWGDWYLFGSTGKIQTGLQKWAGTYYYFDATTYLKRTNAYVKSAWGDWYMFGSNGRIVTGWYRYMGHLYYFMPGTYLKATGYFYVNGQKHYANAAGIVLW